jgi:hypothetical protein
MSTAPLHNVLLIGGPDAGKSNYLFRCWLAIDQQQGLLRRAALPSNIEYLRAGVERLLEGAFAGHTPADVHDMTEIPVRSAKGDFAGAIIVPDVAGERVLRIFEDREWSASWDSLIVENTSCLLFVRPDSERLIAPLDWVRCSDLYGEPPTRTQQAGTSEPPTQVLLVEWLQFLRSAFTARVRGSLVPRIGIVVTAWDAVPSEQRDLTADAWLEANLPMLHGYVGSNRGDFEFAVFGVSATAGDLSGDLAFRAQYVQQGPSTFGFVVHTLAGRRQVTSDVTLPIAWALRLV